MNKNKELLDSFTEYCKKYPEQRFFQALRNWLEVSHVYVGDIGKLEDTYYWTGKNED